jgi:hypothetical protein
MKKEKYIIVAIFFLLSVGEIFSQPTSLEHLSIHYKYNTYSRYTYGSNDDITHYFFGFDNFSEAIMRISYVWEEGRYSPVGSLWTLQLNSNNNNNFEIFGGGYTRRNWMSPNGYDYDLSDGEMDYFSDDEGGRRTVSIENNVNSIIVITANSDDGSMPPHFFEFYNISKEELLKIYLNNFLYGIDYILDKKWMNKEQRVTSGINDEIEFNYFQKIYTIADIDRTLRNLTKYEFSIFRNYMFARHGYAFRTKTWNDFFIEYYKLDYNGTRTNNEVMVGMTEYEKTILNMVIEIEQQKE